MLVVHNGVHHFEYTAGGMIPPRKYPKDLVISIDPSKSNFAMIVGDTQGRVRDVFEFSGNNQKRGPAMPDDAYNRDLRAFLSELFDKQSIVFVGLEESILQESAKRRFFNTTMCLTEIRATVRNVFLDVYNVHVRTINNMSWKSHILPEGYRSPGTKYSKMFVRSKCPEFHIDNYFEADVSDALCMYWYIIGYLLGDYDVFCESEETTDVAYEYAVYPPMPSLEFKRTIMNPSYSVQTNIAYICNRYHKNFIIEVPLAQLRAEDYAHAVHFDKPFEGTVVDVIVIQK